MKKKTMMKYTQIMNIEIKPPTFHYLQDLCKAHLHTFAFENISKLYSIQKGERWIPSAEHFIENYLNYQFGGTCFTLNSTFMQLLTELGFDCSLVKLGQTHLAIIVQLDHQAYYVDVGSTAPIFEPINLDLEANTERRFGKEKMEITKSGNQFEYIRWVNGQNRDMQWTFTMNEEIELEHFKPIYEKSIQPGTPFMKILRCQLWQTDQGRSLSLLNNLFTIRYPDGGDTNVTLSTVYDIKQVLETEFRLGKLPVREAVEELERLGIDVFEKA
ncbi:arylamine N-acetyltransferase [Alkalicoccobacillus murimartini]|uniref:Arylamine N-acetyltransferase n=1 Tax=Alkalicoccobacillus murimartini TaxID=171685 RepID=A0ABT9YIF8_9BACI|nr:arylamine N-acetyltransferase [Alkalicoccobacillus murimartini]MDQ0207648.1 arylamine N-acetyltransferase [Alkalicoccobacillus murimartini]